MKREPLIVVFQRVPSEDFAERRRQALDRVAASFADLRIAKARADVARELERTLDEIDRERGRSHADQLEDLAEVQLRALRRRAHRAGRLAGLRFSMPARSWRLFGSFSATWASR